MIIFQFANCCRVIPRGYCPSLCQEDLDADLEKYFGRDSAEAETGQLDRSLGWTVDLVVFSQSGFSGWFRKIIPKKISQEFND